jgi:hypothetical protein
VNLVHASIHYFPHQVANRAILSLESIGQLFAPVGDDLSGLGMNDW